MFQRFLDFISCKWMRPDLRRRPICNIKKSELFRGPESTLSYTGSRIKIELVGFRPDYCTIVKNKSYVVLDWDRFNILWQIKHKFVSGQKFHIGYHRIQFCPRNLHYIIRSRIYKDSTKTKWMVLSLKEFKDIMDIYENQLITA